MSVCVTTTLTLPHITSHHPAVVWPISGTLHHHYHVMMMRACLRPSPGDTRACLGDTSLVCTHAHTHAHTHTHNSLSLTLSLKGQPEHIHTAAAFPCALVRGKRVNEWKIERRPHHDTHTIHLLFVDPLAWVVVVVVIGDR